MYIAGLMPGWLAGRLAGWPHAGLAGWLAGRLSLAIFAGSSCLCAQCTTLSISLYLSLSLSIYIYICLSISLCKYIYIYIYIYVYTYICMCTYIYIYIYMSTYMWPAGKPRSQSRKYTQFTAALFQIAHPGDADPGRCVWHGCVFFIVRSWRSDVSVG